MLSCCELYMKSVCNEILDLFSRVVRVWAEPFEETMVRVLKTFEVQFGRNVFHCQNLFNEQELLSLKHRNGAEGSISLPSFFVRLNL